MSRPFSVEACDFSGWATRNDLKCSDGRVIRRDAFKNNDGIKVPLVWNHQHNSPRDVLGHAWLENREEGVYTYGFLNDTADGEIAKVLIKHGDICALSIYANQLQQAGPDVLHGCICEVSLVHKGANPGAFIDSMLKHGEMSDDEAIIYTGMPLCLSHSAESKDDPEDEEKKDSKEDKPAENKEEKKDNEETIADVIDSMSEKQQNVMYALIAQALEGEPEKESKDDSDNKSESNKEDNTMKHNVFDNDQQKKTEVLSHADQASIISMAKSNSVGSLRTAMDIYAEQNPDSVLAHGIMIGDGREVGADGKIAEDKIRPIWLDDELYTIHADVDIAGMKATLQGTNTSANFGENYIYAEAVIQSLLYAREKYKGSGTPDFYCTPHLVNVMLLARDLNGRRIYDKVSDLAAALNVGQIITAEQFEGKTRTTTDSKTKKLLGLMVNLADYSLGATKGGEITHFTDFDIDFNQEKSLLETRCSGANTRVMSAIALEEDVTTNIGG